MLPPDLAGQVRELQSYEFTSQEASQRFEELLDQLRQQLMQRYVNQMASGMENVSPEQMQRLKDMLAGLNEMLERRERGEDPRVRAVHGALRRLLPREPAVARRAARGHGPADGRHAGHAQLDDARAAGAAPAARGPADGRHGPALADGPAGPAPALAVPPDGLGPVLQLPGDGPAGLLRGRRHDAAARRHRPAGEPDAGLDQPGRAGRGRPRPGAGPARRRRRPLAGAPGRAGPHAGGGRADREPRGSPRADARRASAASAQNALSDLFTKLAKDKMGQHQITADRHRPRAQLREQGLRVRRPVQPRPAPHHPQRHPAPGRAARRCASRRTTSRSS